MIKQEKSAVDTSNPGYISCKRKRNACDHQPPPLVVALVDGGEDIEWALAILPEGDARLPDIFPEVEKQRGAETAKREGALYCSGCQQYHPIEEFGDDRRNLNRHGKRYTCRTKTNERKAIFWKRG